MQAQLPGPITLRLSLDDLTLTDVVHNLLIAKGSRSGVPRVVAVDHNETRTLTGTMILTDVSKDAVIAQLAAVNVLLRAGTTLTLQSLNATYSVSLKVLASNPAVPPLGDPLFEADSVACEAKVPFALVCEPYLYGPEATLYNGSVTGPTTVDITVPGDFAAPLYVSFTPSTAILHSLYLGLLPDQSVPATALIRAPETDVKFSVSVATGSGSVVCTSAGHPFIVGESVMVWNNTTTGLTNASAYTISAADANTFTIPASVSVQGTATFTSIMTYAATPIDRFSDANARTGYAVRYNQATAANWQIFDQMIPAGTYKLLARLGRSAAGTASFYSTVTGGSSSTIDASASAIWELHDLGSAALPHRRYLAGTNGGFNFYFKTAGTGYYAELDSLILLPTSWGWALVTPAAAATAAAALVHGYDGQWYSGGYSSTDGARSGGLSAVGTQRLMVVPGRAEDANNSGTVTGTLLVKLIPRYALWR